MHRPGASSSRQRFRERTITIVLMALLALWSQEAIPAQKSGIAHRSAIVLDIDGAIGPATAEYVDQDLRSGVKRNASLIILTIDTPGGLSSSMRDIIRHMLASPIPIIAYVSPSGARAASAGTYILYASQLAAMVPGTNLGAATPVQLGGESQPLGGGADKGGSGSKNEPTQAPMDAHMAKAVNDAAAYIRSLAELQGRNADWAEQAVREAASLPASAALEKHVIEIIAPDLHSLLEKADGRTVKVNGKPVTLETRALTLVSVKPGWRARLLATITNPNIAYILLLVGIYGIVFEFLTPGTMVPGTVGAIALFTGLFALDFLPINYAGAVFVLLGVAMLVAEAFLPSFGALGIGGVVAFALGSLFMFRSAPGFTLSPWVVVTATAASVALLLMVVTVAFRAHRRKVVSGAPAMIGSTGKVLSWSASRGGTIQVHGERWQARSDIDLGKGDTVRVIERDDLVLVVEPVPPAEP